MIGKCVVCGCGDIEDQSSTTCVFNFGLDNEVTLRGPNVLSCTVCGEEYTGIPRAMELNAVLATRVATKRDRLTTKEFRCLCKWLKFLGVDFIEKMMKKLISAVHDEDSADAVYVVLRNHGEAVEKMQRALDRRLVRVRKS